MRFIQADGGDYLATDTLAKITDVSIKRDTLDPNKTLVVFTVETKRGDKYKTVLYAYEFNALVGFPAVLPGIEA